MVKIGLQFKAFLENVTGLIPEGEDFRLVVGFLSLKDVKSSIFLPTSEIKMCPDPTPILCADGT